MNENYVVLDICSGNKLYLARHIFRQNSTIPGIKGKNIHYIGIDAQKQEIKPSEISLRNKGKISQVEKELHFNDLNKLTEELRTILNQEGVDKVDAIHFHMPSPDILKRINDPNKYALLYATITAHLKPGGLIFSSFDISLNEKTTEEINQYTAYLKSVGHFFVARKR